jgi:DNA polymerase V
MPIFLLVDCNNFYVSCQRIFNPALEKKPVVVLSNNDGCIIARSNEVKSLGVPMGAPYFKYRPLLIKHKAVVFSSNYELYGDISNRIMTILRDICADIEIYSIDEAFLRIESPHTNLMDFCISIRRKIKMWVGVPVSIGIGPNKTLAKAANIIAKRQNLSGICDLTDPHLQNQMLSELEIGGVWGIGHRLATKLNKLGIYNARQLRDIATHEIRKRFGVTVERTVLELRGVACLTLQAFQPRRNIISSRSFSQALQNIVDIEEAISQFVATACVKLRKQHSKAQGICVFLQTNLFSQEKPYSNSLFCSFDTPTDDTAFIIRAAKQVLQKIYLPYCRYKKAGIMLTNTVFRNSIQEDLFVNAAKHEKRDHLMQVLDEVNIAFGKRSLFLAAQGTKSDHFHSALLKSPCFTTKWTDILTIKLP